MYSAELCGSKAVHSMWREGYPSGGFATDVAWVC
jgi:hypothetical protein